MAELSPPWVEWVAENLLRGAPLTTVVAALVAAGSTPEAALDQVRQVARSPVFAGARRLVERSAAVEQAARLLRTVAEPALREVTALDEDELLRAHWAVSRPVVLRGGARGWPALGWTPESLAARFGDVRVDALVGRTTRRDWWEDRPGHTRRLRFGDVLALVATGEGDDVYCDARTHLLAQPGLEGLAAELGTLPGLVGDGQPSLWVGPRGTHTPLHHDQSTGWLVQLVGHKRVWLASPLESALYATAEGLYNRADLRAPLAGEQAEVAVHPVELAPGDALLIPIGWWHQVEATAPSISASLSRFRWPNTHEWYAPGRARTWGPTTT